MAGLIPELAITGELDTVGRDFLELVILYDRLSKFGRTVTMDTATKDVEVYDCGGRMVCWISGAVQDRYVVYDAEEMTQAERKAIDAYAGLPTGTETEANGCRLSLQ